jgi:hypothetical protein
MTTRACWRREPTVWKPSPYPVDGDQFGHVEYAPDKAGWQRQEQARTEPVPYPRTLSARAARSQGMAPSPLSVRALRTIPLANRAEV